MPGPLSPIVSSRPYGPPDTEKKMIPTIAASPSLRVRSRTSICGRLAAGSSATVAMFLPKPEGVV